MFEWGITYSYEQAQKIWDTHKVENTCGTSFIRRKTGAYNIRQGVTQEPIVKEDLNFVSPLHSYLRIWDFVLKLIIRLRVSHYNWTDSDKSFMNFSIKTEKKKVIDIISEMTGEKFEIADPTGHGGTSTNGPVIKRLFGQHVSTLIDLVPEKHRMSLQKCILSLN